MKSITVKLKTNPYKILIGKKILPSLGRMLKKISLPSHALIITHPIIKKYYGAKIERSLRQAGFVVKFFEVPEGEKSKSATTAISLLERMARYDALKRVFVLALGGGVVGDLSGYVASVYKRGVPYIQVPTTLLAQIDSAIGGKVAIDLSVGKNLVGSFYQPKLVFSDVTVLKSLKEREIKNGLSEAVKYGVIYDVELFQSLEENYEKLLAGNLSYLEKIVTRCSQIKAQVVMKDEKETKSIRTILNFGHTIGHAIEAAGGYQLYHHGEAIALGMRVASLLSREMTHFPPLDILRLNRLLSNIGLPEKIEKVGVSRILSIMNHDKKFLSGKNRFVLAVKLGKVKVVSGVPLALIKKAVETFT